MVVLSDGAQGDVLTRSFAGRQPFLAENGRGNPVGTTN
jgi:hypothetical protein